METPSTMRKALGAEIDLKQAEVKAEPLKGKIFEVFGHFADEKRCEWRDIAFPKDIRAAAIFAANRLKRCPPENIDDYFIDLVLEQAFEDVMKPIVVKG